MLWELNPFYEFISFGVILCAWGIRSLIFFYAQKRNLVLIFLLFLRNLPTGRSPFPDRKKKLHFVPERAEGLFEPCVPMEVIMCDIDVCSIAIIFKWISLQITNCCAYMQAYMLVCFWVSSILLQICDCHCNTWAMSL